MTQSAIIIDQSLGELSQKLAYLPRVVTKQVMDQVARQSERAMLDLYRQTTKTWTNKPDFRSTTRTTSNTIVVAVGTDDPIYGYVDRGTKAHEIVPKQPGYPLRFRSQYQAKTMPGVIGSNAGGASGSWVRAMRVWHPGTKARAFSAMIFRQVQTAAFQLTMKLLDKEIKRHFHFGPKRIVLR